MKSHIVRLQKEIVLFYLVKHIAKHVLYSRTLFRVSAIFYLCQKELGGVASINQWRFVQAHYAVLPPSYRHKIRSYRRENPVLPIHNFCCKTFNSYNLICLGPVEGWWGSPCDCVLGCWISVEDACFLLKYLREF